MFDDAPVCGHDRTQGRRAPEGSPLAPFLSCDESSYGTAAEFVIDGALTA